MLRSAYRLAANYPQVLIWGEADDLRRLATLLLEKAVSGQHETLVGQGSPDPVLLSVGETPSGMQKVDGRLEWRIAPSDASHFAELIEVLTNSEHGHGHQYLDCKNCTEIEVKVSLGEYPDDFMS